MRGTCVLLGCLLVGCASDDGASDDGVGTSAAATNDAGATSTVTSDPAATSTGAGHDTTGGDPPPPGTGTSGGAATGDAAGDATTGGTMSGQWADTQITYTGAGAPQVVMLDDCQFCDATLNGPTLLVRFQQAGGWTVWSVDIPIGSSVGAQPITNDFSGAYVAINEQNPDLVDIAGFFAPTTGSGTLTLTQADITSGGVVAGTLDAQLSLDGITAQLEAEFYAEIP